MMGTRRVPRSHTNADGTTHTMPEHKTSGREKALARYQATVDMRDELQKLSLEDVQLFDGISSAMYVFTRFILSIILNHARMKFRITVLEDKIRRINT